MGIYLNPGDDKFQKGRRSSIYVDKSGIIAYLNQVFDTENRFICVSRPRRFGKSMAANMIAAYYDRTVDVKTAFEGLAITKHASHEECCGRYDAIQINMQDFLSSTKSMDKMLDLLQKI